MSNNRGDIDDVRQISSSDTDIEDMDDFVKKSPQKSMVNDDDALRNKKRKHSEVSITTTSDSDNSHVTTVQKAKKFKKSKDDEQFSYRKEHRSFGPSSSSSADPSYRCQNAIHQGNLDRYLMKRPRVKLQSFIPQLPINITDLTSTDDNEYWIIQCPTSISLMDLQQQEVHKFKTNAITKIPNKNIDVYCEMVTPQKQDEHRIIISAAAVPENERSNNKQPKLVSVPITGKLTVHEQLINDEQQLNETKQLTNNNNNNTNDLLKQIIEEQTVKTPFPDNLKERHPIFGHNYQEHINLPKNVQKRLNKIK